MIGNGGLAASPDAVVGLGNRSLDSVPPELLNEILSRLPRRARPRLAPPLGVRPLPPHQMARWSEPQRRQRHPPALLLPRPRVQPLAHRRGVFPPLRPLAPPRRLLALRGVQTLYLDFERSDEELVHTLHPSIFSCRGFTVLELRGCDIPPCPQASQGSQI